MAERAATQHTAEPDGLQAARRSTGGDKDERKATQLAECMQLFAEYFCCCAALRRGRRSRLDNKPRRQAQVCWLQDSGRRLTRRVCLNRAATDKASVRAAGERWRQSDVERHCTMNRNCAFHAGQAFYAAPKGAQKLPQTSGCAKVQWRVIVSAHKPKLTKPDSVVSTPVYLLPGERVRPTWQKSEDLVS